MPKREGYSLPGAPAPDTQAESEGVEPSGVTLARFSRPLADRPAPPSKAVPPGFEPRPRGSEPLVLPLHQGTLARLVGYAPTSTGFGDRRVATTQAHGSTGTRTRSFQLMRLACYRYTIEQSPTPGSNRRAQFGRLVCFHYISGAPAAPDSLSGLKGMPSPHSSLAEVKCDAALVSPFWPPQPGPDGRNRTSITCSQGRRYTVSLHPDSGSA